MWILISVRDNTDLQSVRTMEARTIDKCRYADICSWKKLSEVISNMKCAGMFRGQDDKIKLPFYLRILIPKLCCTKGHQGNRSYCVYAWNTHLSNGLTEKVTSRAFRNKPTTVSKSLPSQSTLQFGLLSVAMGQQDPARSRISQVCGTSGMVQTIWIVARTNMMLLSNKSPRVR